MKSIIFLTSTAFLFLSSCVKRSEESSSSSKLSMYQEQAANEGWSFSLRDNEFGAQADSYQGIDENIRSASLASFSLYDEEEDEDDDIESEEKIVLPPKLNWGAGDAKGGALDSVTKVKHQRNCGSCWAFGTVAALESAILVMTGKHFDISEQDLVNKGNSQDGYGSCSGGYFAFGYFKKFGFALEKDEKYQARNGRWDSSLPRQKIVKRYGQVGKRGQEPTELEIKEALVKYGPLAITVNASGPWSYYGGGVFDKCSSTNTNHIVTLTGYDDEKDTWILKNSYDKSWGDNGYMETKRTDSRGRKCNGVARTAAYVVIDESLLNNEEPLTLF